MVSSGHGYTGSKDSHQLGCTFTDHLSVSDVDVGSEVCNSLAVVGGVLGAGCWVPVIVLQLIAATNK